MRDSLKRQVSVKVEVPNHKIRSRIVLGFSDRADREGFAIKVSSFRFIENRRGARLNVLDDK